MITKSLTVKNPKTFRLPAESLPTVLSGTFPFMEVGMEPYVRSYLLSHSNEEQEMSENDENLISLAVAEVI